MHARIEFSGDVSGILRGSLMTSMARRYMVEIGRAATLEMKIALNYRLLRTYEVTHDNDFASFLAAAVVNRIFADTTDKPAAAKFLEENEELVEAESRTLSVDHDLCELLTSTVYVRSYARFLEHGGKIGFFGNRFIGYIRATSLSFRDPSYVAVAENHLRKLCDLDPKIVEPVVNLLRLGIFRPLPWNPNEKEFYQRVHAFAIREGVTFK